MWFFPRNGDHGNVVSSDPNPSTWGKPYASFKVCKANDQGEFFENLQLIINTTLCGQWAGNSFIKGDKESWKKCNEYVANAANNDKFKDAYWSINSIKVFLKPLLI